MTSLRNSQVAVVGLGLMGGSLAAALSMGDRCAEVWGIARREWSIREARRRRWIDRGTLDLREGVHAADIVVLATPVRTITLLINRIGPWLREGCLLMDLGSTKQQVTAAMQELPAGVEPVGGHPMCGKELSGLEAAEPGLYRDATFVLTPLQRTSPNGLALAQELVRAVGAHPLILGPSQHDWLVAAVSHLPYCLAAALVQTAEEVGAEEDHLWELATSGFSDTSRLAASGVPMMRDILLTNQEAIAKVLRRFQRHVDRWLGALEADNESELEVMMQAVCSRRRGLVRLDRGTEG